SGRGSFTLQQYSPLWAGFCLATIPVSSLARLFSSNANLASRLQPKKLLSVAFCWERPLARSSVEKPPIVSAGDGSCLLLPQSLASARLLAPRRHRQRFSSPAASFLAPQLVSPQQTFQSISPKLHLRTLGAGLYRSFHSPLPSASSLRI